MGYNFSDCKKIYLIAKYIKVNIMESLNDVNRWYGTSCRSTTLKGKKKVTPNNSAIKAEAAHKASNPIINLDKIRATLHIHIGLFSHSMLALRLVTD